MALPPEQLPPRGPRAPPALGDFMLPESFYPRAFAKLSRLLSQVLPFPVSWIPWTAWAPPDPQAPPPEPGAVGDGAGSAGGPGGPRGSARLPLPLTGLQRAPCGGFEEPQVSSTPWTSPNVLPADTSTLGYGAAALPGAALLGPGGCRTLPAWAAPETPQGPAQHLEPQNHQGRGAEAPGDLVLPAPSPMNQYIEGVPEGINICSTATPAGTPPGSNSPLGSSVPAADEPNHGLGDEEGDIEVTEEMLLKEALRLFGMSEDMGDVILDGPSNVTMPEDHSGTIGEGITVAPAALELPNSISGNENIEGVFPATNISSTATPMATPPSSNSPAGSDIPASPPGDQHNQGPGDSDEDIEVTEEMLLKEALQVFGMSQDMLEVTQDVPGNVTMPGDPGVTIEKQGSVAPDAPVVPNSIPGHENIKGASPAPNISSTVTPGTTPSRSSSPSGSDVPSSPFADPLHQGLGEQDFMLEYAREVEEAVRSIISYEATEGVSQEGPGSSPKPGEPGGAGTSQPARAEKRGSQDIGIPAGGLGMTDEMILEEILYVTGSYLEARGENCGPSVPELLTSIRGYEQLKRLLEDISISSTATSVGSPQGSDIPPQLLWWGHCRAGRNTGSPNIPSGRRQRVLSSGQQPARTMALPPEQVPPRGPRAPPALGDFMLPESFYPQAFTKMSRLLSQVLPFPVSWIPWTAWAPPDPQAPPAEPGAVGGGADSAGGSGGPRGSARLPLPLTGLQRAPCGGFEEPQVSSMPWTSPNVPPADTSTLGYGAAALPGAALLGPGGCGTLPAWAASETPQGSEHHLEPQNHEGRGVEAPGDLVLPAPSPVNQHIEGVAAGINICSMATPAGTPPGSNNPLGSSVPAADGHNHGLGDEESDIEVTEEMLLKEALRLFGMSEDVGDVILDGPGNVTMPGDHSGTIGEGITVAPAALELPNSILGNENIEGVFPATNISSTATPMATPPSSNSPAGSDIPASPPGDQHNQGLGDPDEDIEVTEEMLLKEALWLFGMSQDMLEVTQDVPGNVTMPGDPGVTMEKQGSVASDAPVVPNSIPGHENIEGVSPGPNISSTVTPGTTPPRSSSPSGSDVPSSPFADPLHQGLGEQEFMLEYAREVEEAVRSIISYEATEGVSQEGPGSSPKPGEPGGAGTSQPARTEKRGVKRGGSHLPTPPPKRRPPPRGD
ncbi:collagen alpha-2(I) chain-like [Strigops habroptila]|uniref:collagen alpha-2(I) chain-like n=1 Tax=Strigops habroptila TaxID=2489341 RepID=UPI0011CF9C74|nr:collagen alpha-2(I) chain-like [Strigops habroptila]